MPSKQTNSSAVDINGYALREIRKLRGLTPAQLAKEIGRDRSYVAKIELGHPRVSTETFDRLVLALALEDDRALRSAPHAPVAVAS